MCTPVFFSFPYILPFKNGNVLIPVIRVQSFGGES